MLEVGIIHPRSSHHSSLVMHVWEKDGNWRFCVDYRKLNKQIIRDKYPIPVIQEMVDELHEAQFNKLDMLTRFSWDTNWPRNIEKTSFRTHSGHYEFLAMHFALTNALATFQSAMNDLVLPYLHMFISVFLTSFWFKVMVGKSISIIGKSTFIIWIRWCHYWRSHLLLTIRHARGGTVVKRSSGDCLEARLKERQPENAPGRPPPFVNL